MDDGIWIFSWFLKVFVVQYHRLGFGYIYGQPKAPEDLVEQRGRKLQSWLVLQEQYQVICVSTPREY